MSRSHSGQSSPRRRLSSITAAVAAVTSAALAGLVVHGFMEARQSSRLLDDLAIQSQSTSAAALRSAQATLKNRPINASLVRSLAFIAEKKGQTADATGLMKAAGGLSWRDLPTNAWLFDYYSRRGEYANAVRRADALLRTKQEISTTIFPVLVSAAGDPVVSKAIVDRLAHNPSWREPFLQTLTAKADPATSFAVLGQLQRTSAPLLEREAAGYVGRLVSLERYDEAFLSLVLFLPPRRLSALNGLFNGEFDDIGGIAPFDWAIEPIVGGSLTMENPPVRSEDRALHVLYDGTSSSRLIYQVLALPVGRHRLSGEAFSNMPDTSTRMMWTISCLSAAPLATASPFADEVWRKFTLDVTIPPNCGAQTLQLQSSPSNRRATVEVWYDKLSIASAP